MGNCLQPRLRTDALTGEWRNGEAGEGRGSEPCEPGGLRHQAGGASLGPPTRTRWENITWPDQVAPRGRKASSTRKIKPQTSNLDTLSHPSRERDLNLNLVHDVLDQSLSAMPKGQQRRNIFASGTMKPDRVVRSRGRSGMGSNIAWHRRHNDSVWLNSILQTHMVHIANEIPAMHI